MNVLLPPAPSGNPTCVEVQRADAAAIEYVASEICNATANGLAKWKVCEIWREDGELALPNAAGAPATVKLTLAFGAGETRGCFSPMRAPRGHVCPKCFEDPTAKLLRTACAWTFSPGIGLVGRSWLLGRAEVVDLPPGQQPSTYARQEAAERARMATVVAVPVVKVAGGARAPTAVVVVYFLERLAAAVARPDARTTLAQDAVEAMLRRGRAAAARMDAALPPLEPVGRVYSVSPPEAPVGGKLSARPSSDPADRQYAKAFARHGRADHRCPVCHGTVERAARVRACSHFACSACLARWGLTSGRCPQCHGLVDEVYLDPELDAEVARAARTQAVSF